MSAQAPIHRITAPQIAARKGQVPIVALTAYTAPMAALVDDHAEVILVGDSLGMVIHGLPSTIGVTVEMMILHGQAVMRGSQPDRPAPSRQRLGAATGPPHACDGRGGARAGSERLRRHLGALTSRVQSEGGRFSSVE